MSGEGPAMRCGECGHANANGQGFCAGCGTRLREATASSDDPAVAAYTPEYVSAEMLATRSAVEGERKPVTVLFCDICDSTGLAERIGAEHMHAVLSAFFETALAEVHRYGGTINQFLGDGFMALFGAPVSYEDHSRRAVLAALAIRRALLAEISAAGDIRLHVRMGMNSGAVVVGRIGDRLREDYTAIGDTTNVAARVLGEAEPDDILVTEAVWQATREHAQFDALGFRVLKGKTAAVPIYRLVAADLSPHRPEAPDSPNALVGRAREVPALEAALERLQTRHQGGVVGLIGDAGIGKSRLMEAARGVARARGLQWLQGNCLSFGQTLSYWSFREVIRAAFAIDERDDESTSWHKVDAGMRALFGEQADELLPYLGTLLALTLPAPLRRRVAALDGAAIGHQIFRAALLLFERSARERPLVVALEDWHWADASSAALLEHLLPLSDSAPILFVVASRLEPQGTSQRFRRAVSPDADPPLLRAVVLELEPLSKADSMRLAEQLLDGGTLPDVARDMLLKRAAGNPFYLGELLRAMIATRAIERGDGGNWRTTSEFLVARLPQTIEGLILARIDRLEDEVKQVLKAAAVVGRTFLYCVLKEVVAVGARLDEDVATLHAAELIDERQLIPELEYAFRHPLIQQATYDSLLEDRRRQMHQRVGETIEQLFAGRLEPFYSMLAYHFAKAHDSEKARNYVFKAAEQADRLAADEEALELYNAVIADADRSQLHGIGSTKRAELDMRVADAHFRAGRHSLALDALVSALQRLGHRLPPNRFALTLAVVRGVLGQWIRPLLSRGNAAVVTPISERDAMACQVWETMAWIHFFTDQLHQLYDCLRLVQITKRDPTVRGHTIGLGVMGLVFSSIGAYRTSRWFHDRASETALAHCNAPTRAHALFFEGFYCQAAGEWQRAIDVEAQAAEICWAAGEIRLWASVMTNLFLCLHRAGQPSMFEIADRLEQVANEAADRHAKTWALTVRAMVNAARGSYREALDAVDRAIPLCREIPEHRALAHALGLRTSFLTRLGQLEGAQSCGVESLRLLRTHRLTGLFSTLPLMSYAEVTVAMLERSRQPDRFLVRAASRAVQQALTQGRRVHDEGAVESLRIAGEFKFVRGDIRGAREAWDRGLRRSEAVGTLPARARVLEVRGRRCNDPNDLNEARRLFEQCHIVQTPTSIGLAAA